MGCFQFFSFQGFRLVRVGFTSIKNCSPKNVIPKRCGYAGAITGVKKMMCEMLAPDQLPKFVMWNIKIMNTAVRHIVKQITKYKPHRKCAGGLSQDRVEQPK